MADITLTVDTSSLRDASKKLDDFGAKVKNMSVLGLSRGINTLQSNIRELVNAERQGTISGNAYQLGLLEIKRAYEQMGYSTQAATAAVRRYAAEIQRQEATRAAEQAARELARAQQEAAAAAQRLADRQQQLRIRFQEGYALFTQQRQAMRDLREAYRANIVTLEQYQARLAQIRAGNLSGHINQQSQGMNRLNVVTQQAGYQIGDFFVQVQSGTNALVAFGQQATQVIGTLAMLATSTRAIAFFSVLGPVLAIATAIGAYFMRASGATKTLKDRLSELQEVSSNLKENFRTLFDKDLKLTFGSMTDSVRALTEAMLKLNSAAQINRLEELSKKLGDSAKPGFFSKTATVTGQELLSVLGFGDVGKAVEDLNEEAFQKLGLSMARSQFFKYQEELTKLAKAGDRQGVVDLITEMTNDATDFGSTADKVTLKGAEMLQQMADAAMLLAESEALLNGSSEAAKQAVELEKRKLEAIQLYNKNLADQNALNQERDAAVKRIVQTRDEELTSLRQQRDLLETTLKFGKDSEEVKAKEAEIARAVYMQEQVRNGILGNNLTLVMDEYDAMAKVRGEVETAADSAKLFADNLKEAVSAMQSLMGLGSNIEKALAVANAKVIALKNNADEATAGTVAGYRFDIAQKRSEAIAAGIDPGFVNPIAAKQNADVTALEKALLEADQLGDSKKGGSKSKTEKQDSLEKLKEQLALQNELIGATEAQQRVFTALGEDRSKYSKKEIEAITAEIAAYNVKMETIKKQEQLMNSAKSALEDGFMAMVDGTMSVKDAFKSMARDIIKELYRVLVVQRMVNSIAGVVNGFMNPATPTTTSFNTPNFFGGGRASGGSMMGGNAYLVGEHGPELVVPRHSGTVMNANQTANALGGGSGNVTVQNNITVTGSDAAMVRAEVAKMIPQITNATKAAVIDAKQRGGQMAAAFR